MFDGIVVLLASTDVGFGEGGFRAFLGVVEAPVNAVDVEMIKVTARADAVHGELGVAGHDVAHTDHPAIILERPRVVLHRAEVELVEALRTGRPEDGIVQLRRAVFLTEEETEGVLRIVPAPAESATDAQTAVRLEAIGVVGVKQFDGRSALVGDAVTTGVVVDVDEVGDVQREGESGDRLEIALDGGGVDRVGKNLRIHSVIPDLATAGPWSRPSGAGCNSIRLANDVVEKDIGLRIHVGGEQSGLVSRRAKRGGFVDRDRDGVNDPAAGRGRGAIRGVANGHTGSRAGDGEGEGSSVEPTLVAELRVPDNAGDRAHAVAGSRALRLEIAGLVQRVEAPRIIGALVRVRVEGGDELPGDFGVVEPDEFAIGAQAEVGVESRARCRGAAILAGAEDDEVATTRDGDGRERPFRGLVLVVGKRPAREADGAGARVVKLHPVLDFVVFVPEAVDVGGGNFVDANGVQHRIGVQHVAPSGTGEVVRNGGEVADVMADDELGLDVADRRLGQAEDVLRSRQRRDARRSDAIDE